MSENFGGIGTELVIKSLDAIWLRQRVISNNIANSATPGYKSKTVEFESLLRGLLKGSNPNYAAVGDIEPKLVESNAVSDSENGNNVVLDKENIELARAQFQYEALITSLNAQINRMKYALSGGQ